MNRISLLISLIAVLFLVACDNDDNGFNSNSPEAQNLRETLISDGETNGLWRISRFVEDGIDETSDFTGFTFDFQTNDVIIANHNDSNTNGTWLSFTDDGRLELRIEFGSSNLALQELNDDWYFVRQSDTEIVLEERNEQGGTDTLIFTRAN